MSGDGEGIFGCEMRAFVIDRPEEGGSISSLDFDDGDSIDAWYVEDVGR